MKQCNRISRLGIILVYCICASCQEFVDVGVPQTRIVTATVYTDDATAISAISGIYSQMINSGFLSGYPGSLTHLTGLSSDEFINHANYLSFQTNSIVASDGDIKNSLWDTAYKYIYYSNSVLEGLSKSDGVSTSVRAQLEGEAKFVRAICHFYLTNLFGEVPIIKTTDYRINRLSFRMPEQDVYEQIISDLNDATEKLSSTYSISNDERVRPNKFAAKALLARVYLYLGRWEDAERLASEVIDNPMYTLTENLNEVFLKNSSEAIFQLKPTNPNQNTPEAEVLIPSGFPSWVSIRQSLINEISADDDRGSAWIDSVNVGGEVYYYPFKYKVIGTVPSQTEYYMVLRVAEQFLIRSEARAMLDDLNGSISDIDMIRSRAGLPTILSINPGITKPSLLLEIEQQRRIELVAELGHRWFDLKRVNRAGSILENIKTPNWQATDVLYPIPQAEIDNGPNITQNPGY